MSAPAPTAMQRAFYEKYFTPSEPSQPSLEPQIQTFWQFRLNGPTPVFPHVYATGYVLGYAYEKHTRKLYRRQALILRKQFPVTRALDFAYPGAFRNDGTDGASPVGVYLLTLAGALETKRFTAESIREFASDIDYLMDNLGLLVQHMSLYSAPSVHFKVLSAFLQDLYELAAGKKTTSLRRYMVSLVREKKDSDTIYQTFKALRSYIQRFKHDVELKKVNYLGYINKVALLHMARASERIGIPGLLKYQDLYKLPTSKKTYLYQVHKWVSTGSLLLEKLAKLPATPQPVAPAQAQPAPSNPPLLAIPPVTKQAPVATPAPAKPFSTPLRDTALGTVLAAVTATASNHKAMNPGAVLSIPVRFETNILIVNDREGMKLSVAPFKLEQPLPEVTLLGDSPVSAASQQSVFKFACNTLFDVTDTSVVANAQTCKQLELVAKSNLETFQKEQKAEALCSAINNVPTQYLSAEMKAVLLEAVQQKN